MLKIILFWLWFIPVSATVQDSVEAERPRLRYYKAQFAGNLGLVSAGAGYDFPASKIWADINLGYLPKHVNGVRVFTVSLKPAYRITEGTVRKTDVGWYIGAALNYSLGRNIFGSMPDYYPLDYYWPNAFHLNPFTGVRLSLNQPDRKNRTFFYAEVGTVEYEIWFALKNKNVNITDIINLGFGIIIRPNRTTITNLRKE